MKTLFFNLNLVEELDYVDALLALKMYYYKTLPKNKRSKLVNLRISRMFGSSFLINPEPILNDKSTDPIYLIQYLRLAGRRNYMMYTQYNIKYLDLSFYPDINISRIKHNPLLKLANDKIYFKHEELI